MGMIKRQFGPSVKMEAINKLVGQQIYKYVQDNNCLLYTSMCIRDRHSAARSGEEEEETVDPRWEALLKSKK